VPVKTKVPQAFNQNLLTALLNFSTSTATLALDSGDNQRRNDAEVERRHLNGVPVGEAPMGSPGTTQTNVASAYLRADAEERKKRRAATRDSDERIVRKAIEATKVMQDMKKKYEEEAKSAAENYEARLAQADKLVRELQQALDSALSRERELKERLLTAQIVNESMEFRLLQKEVEFTSRLPLLAASVKEISDDLEECMA